MTREQLAHVLRAASDIVTEDPVMLVLGSQSVLAVHDFDDPAEAKADRLDAAIGELSLFHKTFGIYAQGVSISTAVLPEGWRDRLVAWSNASTGSSRAVFLEPHDCVISKLVAHREKDLAFAEALLDAGLVDIDVLLARADLLPVSVHPAVGDAVSRWLAAWKARQP